MDRPYTAKETAKIVAGAIASLAIVGMVGRDRAHPALSSSSLKPPPGLPHLIRPVPSQRYWLGLSGITVGAVVRSIYLAIILARPKVGVIPIF
jgi:hypothetical protein